MFFPSSMYLAVAKAKLHSKHSEQTKRRRVFKKNN
jgi:hypothetical protein